MAKTLSKRASPRSAWCSDATWNDARPAATWSALRLVARWTALADRSMAVTLPVASRPQTSDTETPGPGPISVKLATTGVVSGVEFLP